MNGAQRAEGGRPDHWIGIQADYREKPGHASEYLYQVSRQDLATHALLLGKTGSGKTVCLTHLIAGAILRKESFVLVDARGDQVNDVLNLLAGRVEPERVKVIDLRDSTPHMGFNPLHGSGLAHKRALNVLETIRTMNEGWGVQLEETLRNFLTAMAESHSPLTELERALYDPVYRELLVSWTETESVRAFITRFHQMREDRQASLAMPVMNKVSALFATRKLREILQDENSINLYEHLETRGNILLVSLAIDETAGVGRAFGSMFLGCLTQTMFARVYEPEQYRPPVMLVLDEFSHFADEDIDEILAEGRRFGFSVVLAHQTLSQVSPHLRSMTLGNVGMKFIFRLGREDSQTMSADLTGNPKSIDFTQLRVGTCVAQKGNASLMGVEINAPIGSGGSLDADGRDYLAAIHREHPNWQYTDPVAQKALDDLEELTEYFLQEKERLAHEKRADVGASLEDWI